MATNRPPVKTRLRKWHLKQVPFPSVPFVTYFSDDPICNGSVFAKDLRQEQVDQIRRDILRFGFPQAVQRWSWVWAHKKLGGSLGMGKTALLGYVTDQINADYGNSFMGGAIPWLAVYVKVPETAKSVHETAAIALESMYRERHGTSVERLLLARLRREVIMLGKQGRYPQNLGTAKVAEFARDEWLDAHKIDQAVLAGDVKEKLMQAGVRAEVAKAFSTASLKEYLGKYKDDADAAPFKKASQAEAWPFLLNDMARMALAADRCHVTFFLDDLYYVVKNTSPAERDKLAETFRGFVVTGGYRAVQSNIYNWVAVMHSQTATGFNYAWEKCDMHKVAPMIQQNGTNIVRPGVHLYALKADQGKCLLETYLAYSRVGRVPSSSFPFTSDALDYIVEYAGQRGHEEKGSCDPRNVLEVAHDVLVRALMDTVEHPEIDLALAKHILAGTPLPLPASSVDIEANERADEEEIPPSEQKSPASMVCSCTCHQEEGTVPNDVVTVLSGGTAQNAQPRINGYRCRACGAPIVLDISA